MRKTQANVHLVVFTGITKMEKTVSSVLKTVSDVPVNPTAVFVEMDTMGQTVKAPVR